MGNQMEHKIISLSNTQEQRNTGKSRNIEEEEVQRHAGKLKANKNIGKFCSNLIWEQRTRKRRKVLIKPKHEKILVKPYLRASGPGRHRGFPQLGESETKRGSVGLLTINGWLYSLKFGPFGQRWLDLVVANGWAERKPKDKDKNLVEGKDWHPNSERDAASIMVVF